MVRPLSFEENISSFDTVEYFASAGALPNGLGAWANAGDARTASDAVISAIFFNLSSSVDVMIYNAGCQMLFRRCGNIHDAARWPSSLSRASSDLAESCGSMVATLTTGSACRSRLPWLVWRITLDRRRAMLWAVRRSVSANV